MTLEQISQVALKLDDGERVRLVERLLASLGRRDQPAFADPEIEASWLRVARARGQEVEDGKVEPVPASEAFSRLRREFGIS